MRGFIVCCLGVVLGAFPAIANADTARDVRTTQSVTQWDFQPGQGPRGVRDRDYFDPIKTKKDAVLPAPELVKDDWREPPASEERISKEMPDPSLETETGLHVGLQVGTFQQNQSLLDSSLYGPEIGLAFDVVGASSGHWYLRIDGRAVFGTLNYEGPNASVVNTGFRGDSSFNGEASAVVGHDFIADTFSISPYAGVGIRYVNSESLGHTTLGVLSYRRHGQYLYFPFGVQPRFRLPNNKILSMRAELDYLLLGYQESNLSDADFIYPDLKNRVERGLGLRGEVMYEGAKWSVGPFVNYWNIPRSTRDCETGGVGDVCGFEPHNHSIEAGLQLRYLFHY